MSVDVPGLGLEHPSEPVGAKPRSSFGASLLFSGARPRLLLFASLIVSCIVAWAILEGANTGLALLIGYSAIASSIGLALSVPVKPTQGFDSEPKPERTEPETSVAWKLVNTFTISDASRLWCNIEPGAAATQESMAWGRALLDAVKEGNLPIVARNGSPEAIDRERQNPHYMTHVTREALKHWANEKGHTPPFLRE